MNRLLRRVLLLLVFGLLLSACGPRGRLQWRHEAGNAVVAIPAIGADGTIYVGTHDSFLYALTPEGKVKWSYETGNWVHGAAAIAPDGTIYAPAYDSKLYAFSPDGDL